MKKFISGEFKTNLQRALCINEAENRYQIEMIDPADGDLLDWHHAFRIYLAKKSDAGLVTKEQVDVEWQKHNVEVNSESQKRQQMRLAAPQPLPAYTPPAPSPLFSPPSPPSPTITNCRTNGTANSGVVQCITQ